MLDLFWMSKSELDRAAILERVLAKWLSLRRAATELGLLAYHPMIKVRGAGSPSYEWLA
jgi:hypothetical protein